MVSPKVLQAVCQEVYRQIPQVAGCKPTIKQQPESKQHSQGTEPKYLLVFSNKDKNQNEVPVKTYVRVTINSQGKILKLSISK